MNLYEYEKFVAKNCVMLSYKIMIEETDVFLVLGERN